MGAGDGISKSITDFFAALTKEPAICIGLFRGRPTRRIATFADIDYVALRVDLPRAAGRVGSLARCLVRRAHDSHLFCRREVAVWSVSRTQLDWCELRRGRITRHRHSVDVLLLPDLAVRGRNYPGPGRTAPRQARTERNSRACHGTCARTAGDTPD